MSRDVQRGDFTRITWPRYLDSELVMSHALSSVSKFLYHHMRALSLPKLSDIGCCTHIPATHLKCACHTCAIHLPCFCHTSSATHHLPQIICHTSSATHHLPHIICHTSGTHLPPTCFTPAHTACIVYTLLFVYMCTHAYITGVHVCVCLNLNTCTSLDNMHVCMYTIYIYIYI